MINIELQLSGQYRAVVSTDADCKDVSRDTGWFRNLITDAGLERIGSVDAQSSDTFQSLILNRIYVGSGSATPLVTDTQLQNLVASSGVTTIDSRTSNYTRGYMEMVVRVQYAQGAAAGNLSEVGIGNSSTNLFSRALIVNSAGDPTTITVLPNEFLTVYYTLRCPIPQADILHSINVEVDGVPTATEVIIRPRAANDVSAETWTFKTGFTSTSPADIRTGSISGPTSAPGGAIVSNTTVTRNAYTPSSRVVTGTIFFSINAGSGTYPSLTYKFGPGAWQIGFTPALVKDNTKTLTVVVGFSFARA